MAGYHNYSMSNNAIAAYEGGEMPLSKWTKAEIIKAITPLVSCDIKLVKKLYVSQLRTYFLYQSSWHHTSNWYNKTDFYAIDEDACENITDEILLDMIGRKEKVKACKEKEYKATCKFLEWSGSRKHPKAKEVIEDGVIRGNWFYRSDGTKKSTCANGFEIINIY